MLIVDVLIVDVLIVDVLIVDVLIVDVLIVDVLIVDVLIVDVLIVDALDIFLEYHFPIISQPCPPDSSRYSKERFDLSTRTDLFTWLILYRHRRPEQKLTASS